MSDVLAPLKNLKKDHEYLICIDSDGCAFDSMEIKHKECFIPKIVQYYHLQPVSKFARAAAEFVNLYSKWRGINRFPALTMTLDLLEDWPDVQKRGAKIPKAQGLRDWISRETKLGNPALKAEVERTGDADLALALEWSLAVNETIAELVHDVPPFPYLRESLEDICQWADVIVCSATPSEALVREWEEHDISRYVKVIAGQEMGSKKEIIHLANQGRYPADRILMIGDAPGDMKAARGNDALFFPINPGSEEKSWERFASESAHKFRDAAYTKEYEGGLIAEFDALLPELPPWKR